MRQKKVKQIRRTLKLKLPVEAEYNKVPKKKVLVPNFDNSSKMLSEKPYKEIIRYQYINTNKAMYRRIKKDLLSGAINER